MRRARLRDGFTTHVPRLACKPCSPDLAKGTACGSRWLTNRVVKQSLIADALLGVFLAGLAGCDTFGGHPVDPQPASPAELRASAARVQPEGQTSTASTTSPRGTWETFQQTLRDKRFEDTWPLLSAGTQDACAAAAADLKMRVLNYPTPMARDLDVLHFSGLTRREVEKLTPKMYFVAASKMRDKDPEAFGPVTKAEFDHEVVRGDQAQVFVKIDGRRNDQPMRLVREGGVWRVDLPRAGTTH